MSHGRSRVTVSVRKKKKRSTSSSGSLRVIGIITLIVAFIFFIESTVSLKEYLDTKEYAVEIESTITDIKVRRERHNGETETYHDVYVDYTYDGENYSSKLNYYSSSMHVGDNLTIRIDSREPGNIVPSLGMSIIWLISFSAGGCMWLWFGLKMLGVTYKKNTQSIDGSQIEIGDQNKRE